MRKTTGETKNVNQDFDDGLQNPFSTVFDDHRYSVFKNIIFEGLCDRVLKIRLRRSIQRVEIYQSSKTASQTASKRVRYGHLK